jgi:hypothetical protein
MSRSVFQLLIRDSGLPASQRHLLRVVAEYADSEWPTTKQVAHDMGVTVLTVWGHTAALRESGWLERTNENPPRYRPAIPSKVLPLMMDAS